MISFRSGVIIWKFNEFKVIYMIQLSIELFDYTPLTHPIRTYYQSPSQWSHPSPSGTRPPECAQPWPHSQVGSETLPSNSNQKAAPTFKKNRNLKKISSIDRSNSNSTINNNIKIGDQVEHDRFGKGKVIDLSGESPNIKATVFFPSSGQKQLLLKFAKLQILN